MNLSIILFQVLTAFLQTSTHQQQDDYDEVVSPQSVEQLMSAFAEIMVATSTPDILSSYLHNDSGMCVPYLGYVFWRVVSNTVKYSILLLCLAWSNLKLKNQVSQFRIKIQLKRMYKFNLFWCLVLDMARHIPLYRALLSFLRPLAENPPTLCLLTKKKNDEGASIVSLLSKLKSCVDTYNSRLRWVNKTSSFKIKILFEIKWNEKSAFFLVKVNVKVKYHHQRLYNQMRYVTPVRTERQIWHK